MSIGFGADKAKNIKAKVIINSDEVSKILKKYKKLNKYRRSALFAVEMMDGTENIITQLIREAEENPM